MQVLLIVSSRSTHVFDRHFKVSLACNLFSEINLVLFLYCLCSFDSSSNQAMAKKLLTEVRAVYGKKKWMKSTIKGERLS